MKHTLFFSFIFFFVGIYKSQFNEQLYKKALSDVYQNPDNSIAYAEKMLKNEKNTDNIIKLYIAISNSYISKRDFEKSLDWVLKMKELSKTLNNPEQEIKVLNAIAIQYQQMGLYSTTLETLNDSYKKCIELPDGNFKFYYLGIISTLRGLVYKNQNNNELALEKLKIGLNYLNKVKDYESAIPNSSVILYNIGYCYYYLNQYQNAEKYFLKSAQIANQAKAESLEAFAYKGLSENYTILGKHHEAISLLKKAVSLSLKVNDLVLSEGIYKSFSDNYLALQDRENYEKYKNLYLETKFEREQKELASLNKSIDALNHENTTKIAKQNRNRFVISFLLILSSVIIFFWILRSFISQKKRNKLLMENLSIITKIPS